MSDRITLRLKADHSVVLPEATLYDEFEGYWELLFAPEIELHSFSRSEWEPVPPPYTLPTKLGAVVKFDGGFAVRSDATTRPWLISLDEGEVPWANDATILEHSGLTTLSEGVDL